VIKVKKKISSLLSTSFEADFTSRKTRRHGEREFSVSKEGFRVLVGGWDKAGIAEKGRNGALLIFSSSDSFSRQIYYGVTY
jgi:hypothetical protein